MNYSVNPSAEYYNESIDYEDTTNIVPDQQTGKKKKRKYRSLGASYESLRREMLGKVKHKNVFIITTLSLIIVLVIAAIIYSIEWYWKGF